jgi:hypothetical protein
MSEYISKLEDILKSILLKNVQIYINDHLYKEGQFTLFTHNIFNFQFYLKSVKKNKLEIMKIPYPFEYHSFEKNQQIIFDYRIITFTHNDLEMANIIKSIKKTSTSKYYDTILRLQIKK